VVVKTAVVTGTMGLLGPVWREGLEARGYQVIGYDLPHYDLSMSFDIDKFCSNFFGYIKVPEIIIYNAAIDPKPGADEGIDPHRRYEEILSVNLLGAVRMNRLLIPKMIENGGGLIIIIGSIMGYISANPDNYQDGWLKAFAYNDSKRALQSYCHGINTIYGKQGIRCVMPSFGPYEEGLSPKFMEGFGKKIPVGHPVSKKDILLTLNYCIDCDSLTGEFRVDGGYTRVGR
jgi:NAD(P)-dependent dehydrogenase (short-subunit alcohol dehydrogenase family)